MIPIIDIFAGPGGLGEGFSQLRVRGKQAFEIRLSIEKERDAHRTLTWRSFYRKFVSNDEDLPEEFYSAYQAEHLKDRERIISHVLTTTSQGREAMEEARLVELGSKQWPPEKVDSLIRKALGNEKEWVLIGGPPCQAYSNVGRSRVGGIDPKDHRVYLYKEYLRIVSEHRPVAFVMENVQGMLSAKVNGESVFEKILEDLSMNGKYHIHSFVCDAEKHSDYLIKADDYGVPQTRKRVILFGLADGIKHNGSFLQKKPQAFVEDALNGLPAIRSAIGQITIEGQRKRVQDSFDLWKAEILEGRRDLSKLPWGADVINSIGAMKNDPGIGAEFIRGVWTNKSNIAGLSEWYGDSDRLGGIANHESRSHLGTDLRRYLFSSVFMSGEGRSPVLSDFSDLSPELLPEHGSASRGVFVDRFKCQAPSRPGSTITSHISKDGHYFIHPDPNQCRSLTVREAARIQTFPDNYLFRGSRTAQYRQVGNAVPPMLSNMLARIVHSNIQNL